MSILRHSHSKLRPFAAILAMLALMTLSLGSALGHNTSGEAGRDAAPLALSITSVTDNGDVDEAELDGTETDPVDEADDNGDVDQDTADGNDQGENDNSADEDDQGQDEQADENNDDDQADDNDDSNNQDEGDDGDSGEGGDD